MLITWSITRYSRCYSDTSKQCLESGGGFKPIFQYFAHLQTRQSQTVGDVWSSINGGDAWSLQLNLDINASRQIFLNINLVVSGSGDVVILESLTFPRDFALQFKISARRESIGFRYVINEKKYLFQLFFDNEYNCHLCFDSFSRFGLFSGQWSDPFQFLSPIVYNQTVTTVTTSHTSDDNNAYSGGELKLFEDSSNSHSYPSMRTDTSSRLLKDIYNYPYLTDSLHIITQNQDKGLNQIVDPDATQLEIEQCTPTKCNVPVTVTESQITKRQLIAINDNFDLKSLQHNLMTEVDDENQ